MQEITKHQLSILQWLEAYPQVHIHTTGRLGDERCWGINPWWRSETDRLAMEKVIGLLINENILPCQDSKMIPRKNHLSGKTPNVNIITLNILKNRELIRVHKGSPKTPGMAQQNYYQLTMEGRKAAHGVNQVVLGGLNRKDS